MGIFNFHPDDYTQEYARQGWVHVRAGMSSVLLDAIRCHVRSQLSSWDRGHAGIRAEHAGGSFNFPAGALFLGDVFDAAATVCGMQRGAMALSEQHIEVHGQDADPEPIAEKDRYTSRISILCSLETPGTSRLVLYPYDHREMNPFVSPAALHRSLRPEERPDVVLREAHAVELADEPGDVVIFEGSTTWHRRRHPAGAVSLCVKVNDYGIDERACEADDALSTPCEAGATNFGLEVFNPV